MDSGNFGTWFYTLGHFYINKIMKRLVMLPKDETCFIGLIRLRGSTTIIRSINFNGLFIPFGYMTEEPSNN